MDSPTQTPESVASTAAPAANGQQIVDVVAPPVQTAEEAAETAAGSPTEEAPIPITPPKPKREFTSDIKIAIVATAAIVIALAILATVAFLKQK
jgi:hypothetical protein